VTVSKVMAEILISYS